MPSTPPSGTGPFAPLPPPSGKKSRRNKILASVLTAAGVASLVFMTCGGCDKFKSNNSETAGTSTATPKAPDSGPNLDPTKPAPSATAVAAKDPDCPDGTLWDTKKKVCVQPATVPPFPSSIAITLPCPSNCAPAASASASAPPVASASAPPASSGKSPPSAPPAATLVKVDLTKIGNPAAFPPGN